MHVDADHKVSQVLLLSVGDSVRFALDHGSTCKRIEACERGMGVVTSEIKHAHKSTVCQSCQEVTLRSGDVMIFGR